MVLRVTWVLVAAGALLVAVAAVAGSGDEPAASSGDGAPLNPELQERGYRPAPKEGTTESVSREARLEMLYSEAVDAVTSTLEQRWSGGLIDLLRDFKVASFSPLLLLPGETWADFRVKLWTVRVELTKVRDDGTEDPDFILVGEATKASPQDAANEAAYQIEEQIVGGGALGGYVWLLGDAIVQQLPPSLQGPAREILLAGAEWVTEEGQELIDEGTQYVTDKLGL